MRANLTTSRFVLKFPKFRSNDCCSSLQFTLAPGGRGRSVGVEDWWSGGVNLPTPSLTYSQLTHYPFRFPDYDPAPRAVASERRPYHWGLPLASQDVSIIAKTPRENQARQNEIMVRTKSRRICRAGAEGAFRRNAKRRNRRLSVARACTSQPEANARASEKDGSDPISTRRHFAERLDGTGKM